MGWFKGNHKNVDESGKCVDCSLNRMEISNSHSRIRELEKECDKLRLEFQKVAQRATAENQALQKHIGELNVLLKEAQVKDEANKGPKYRKNEQDRQLESARKRIHELEAELDRVAGKKSKSEDPEDSTRFSLLEVD
jgi:hypothetical protein